MSDEKKESELMKKNLITSRKRKKMIQKRGNLEKKKVRDAPSPEFLRMVRLSKHNAEYNKILRLKDTLETSEYLRMVIAWIEEDEKLSGIPDNDLPLLRQELAIAEQLEELREKYDTTHPVEVSNTLKEDSEYLTPDEKLHNEWKEIVGRMLTVFSALEKQKGGKNNVQDMGDERRRL